MGTKGANGSALDRATRVFRAAFGGAFEKTSTRVLDMLCWYFTGAARANTEHFAVLDGVDVPLHKDRLNYADYRFFEFDSGTDVYAKGIRMRRDDVENDKFGQLVALARALARHMSVTQRHAVIEYLVKGFTGALGTAYDGQFFFDTDHPAADGTVWTNKHALALNASSFDILYNALLSTPTPDGDQLYDSADGEIEVDLIVGPNLKSVADEVVKETINGGEVNPRSTRVNVKVLTDLRVGGKFDAYKNYWWLKAGALPDPELQPLTFAGERTPELTFKDRPDDEDAFETDEYKAKVRGKWGLAYRAPWLIQGSTGA